jgi:hypothetical protein
MGSMAMAETVPKPMPAAHKGRSDAPLIKSRRLNLLFMILAVNVVLQIGSKPQFGQPTFELEQ